MWRAFRDARFLGVFGLLFFAAMIAILNATVYSPEAMVMRYVSALEEGRQADVERAVWGFDGSIPVDVHVPVAAADRPSGSQVVETTLTENGAIVTVQSQLGNDLVETAFALTRAPSWSPLATWVFESAPIGTVTIDSTANSGGSVNGWPVGAEGFAYLPTIATVDSPSRWFTATPQRVPVVNDRSEARATLELTPTDELKADIDSAVRKYVDDCAAAATLVPPECPFAGFTAMAIASGPTWSVERYPTVAIEAGDAEWLVTGTGKVRLTVTLVDFATEKKEPYSPVMTFEISGSLVGLSEGKPRLSVTNTVER